MRFTTDQIVTLAMMSMPIVIDVQINPLCPDVIPFKGQRCLVTPGRGYGVIVDTHQARTGLQCEVKFDKWPGTIWFAPGFPIQFNLPEGV